MPEAALALETWQPARRRRDKATNEKIVQSALSWYQVAAHGGVPSAQFKLANAYLPASACRAIRPGADVVQPRRPAGLPQASSTLGLMLISGAAGQSDPVEGYKWLVLAERGGHPDSKPAREKAGEQIGERDRKRARYWRELQACSRAPDRCPPPGSYPPPGRQRRHRRTEP